MNKQIKFANFRRRVYCYHFLVLEILSTFTKSLKESLTLYRKNVILGELKTIKISAENKILFIGCGFLPSTPIILAEETDAKNIVAIDNIKIFAQIARSEIKKRKISHKIKIEHADGESYPVGDFDFIFIASNAYPIDKILKHLYEEIKPDAQIMYRNIKDDIGKIVKDEKLIYKFSIKNSSIHPAGSDYKSLLLKKCQTDR